MNEIKKAKFYLERFKVTSFSYNESPNHNSALNLGFLPSGEYDENERVFDLTFTFNANEEDKPSAQVINAVLTSRFKFEEKITLAEIPSYFYGNAIAMVYPYLRSFVSTLTLQANGKLVILPVLNLSGLESVLRENTKLKL